MTYVSDMFGMYNDIIEYMPGRSVVAAVFTVGSFAMRIGEEAYMNIIELTVRSSNLWREFRSQPAYTS